MKATSWLAISLAVATALNSASASADDRDAQGAVGAVYTMTNAAAGNGVVVFDRDATGGLSAMGTVATNGLGAGVGIDPLGSQHSLVLSHDREWLLAVNAGSNDISVLRVKRHSLALASKTSSGGTKPVSVAESRGIVYVLNAGDTPNITGFFMDRDGNLTPIANSTRTLASSTFGEVGFDSHGRTLIVTDKGNSQILSFEVDRHGTLSATPVVTPSNGAVPFGFAPDYRGHLLVVEAGANAVSSYSVSHNGTLQSISASVPDGQKASCWIATNGYSYAFTTNPGTQTVSSYQLDVATGALTLLNPTAATGVKPLDVALTPDGRFLYALDVGTQQIDAFQVEKDGSLTNLGPFAGALASYAQGIAVR